MFSTIVIESPYAGNVPRNIAYLRAAIRDCILRGEAPFASHGLYTQPNVLDDNVRDERMLGITAGFALGERLDRVAFYEDLGWSKGMDMALVHWTELGKPTEIRRLDPTIVTSVLRISKCRRDFCSFTASFDREKMGLCDSCFNSEFPRM